MQDEIAKPETEEDQQPMTPELIHVLVEHHRQFLEFLEKRVGSRSDAEDIFQGAVVRGMQKAETIRAEESVVAWFYRVLRNATVDHFRRRAARENFGNQLRSEVPQAEWPELHRAVCQCVGGLVGTLKPEYSTLLERVEIQEETVGDAARALGITPNNAAVRLHRARQALRGRLVQTCGICAEHGCLDCCCKPKV